MMNELRKLKEITNMCINSHAIYGNHSNRKWMYEFNAIDELVFITDTESRINFVNSNLVSTLQAESYEEFIGTYFYESIYDITKEPLTKTRYIKKLDGVYKRTTFPMYDKDQHLIGYIHILDCESKTLDLKLVKGIMNEQV